MTLEWLAAVLGTDVEAVMLAVDGEQGPFDDEEGLTECGWVLWGRCVNDNKPLSEKYFPVTPPRKVPALHCIHPTLLPRPSFIFSAIFSLPLAQLSSPTLWR